MKKVFLRLILAILFILTFFIIILSTFGIETNRFNNLITKKINEVNFNTKLKLNTIKFRLDIKEISLFIETTEPKIYYREVSVPAKKIKVYVDFLSLLKNQTRIKKITLSLEELNIDQLKTLMTAIKPSNLKSLINNKINNGKINLELEFYLDENNNLDNFIAKGKVFNLNAEINKNFIIKKTNFNFFADKTDVLVTNIFSELDNIKIANGDLKLTLSSDIILQSNFFTNVRYTNQSFLKYPKLFKNFKYAEDILNLEADLNNNLLIYFDKTYKIKKYNYKNDGKINKVFFKFKKPFNNYFSEEKISEISLVNSEIKTNLSSNNNTVNIIGEYTINSKDLLKFSLKNNYKKDILNLELDTEYNQNLNFEIINYKKNKGSIANFYLNLVKEKDKIEFKKITLKEKKNLFLIENLEFEKNKFKSFKKILINTYKNGKKNNEFSIQNEKKINIKGSKFDATNLPKILSKKKGNNSISKISKEIEIDFKNIIAPLSKNLKNFKLIGIVDKGKFIKISSKGDFGNNNFLDISMKNDQKNKKKYLEIYSDLPQPLLTQYNFFNGLTGGKLLYSSIIDSNISNSKLKIENFKVINAPGMIKLLSLADLGGLADLAEGAGLSFDLLEINMENNNQFLKLNEILAIGPSISVLMEGYQDKTGMTSLRGTLIPAKSLNKLISKIPVIGDIIIPKEVGEGLFGISFKMKGPPGKIKTSINPIKTITPRFIQKIIERNKNSK
ncbi:AsmA-like C-terminal region-containing protein [Pelagibacteraceae bacterium]|jgi:hypothetical protein|nr:AsmA-like C-terminal region-containing protein [Pelagibacteraceae bacterium]